MTMTSSRPYMIRALYEWIVENRCTPCILVDAHAAEVEVPQRYVNKEGQIMLNISPSAVMNLVIDNQKICFSARFGGIATDITVPCHGVLAIYARENGQGMSFEPELNPPQPPRPRGPRSISKAPKENSTAGKRPSLRVVK